MEKEGLSKAKFFKGCEPKFGSARLNQDPIKKPFYKIARRKPHDSFNRLEV
jgi:hypothetical protein